VNINCQESISRTTCNGPQCDKISDINCSLHRSCLEIHIFQSSHLFVSLQSTANSDQICLVMASDPDLIQKGEAHIRYADDVEHAPRRGRLERTNSRDSISIRSISRHRMVEPNVALPIQYRTMCANVNSSFCVHHLTQ
jgi:hypothetical protein